MPDFSPGSVLNTAVVFIFGGGLASVVAVILNVRKARREARAEDRAADREDRREPLEQSDAVLEFTAKVQALASLSVEASGADRQRAVEAAEQATQALQQATTALQAANERYDRAEAHIVEVHDWIDAGAKPPSPSWPSWLTRRHPRPPHA